MKDIAYIIPKEEKEMVKSVKEILKENSKKKSINIDKIQIKKNHQGDKCTFSKMVKYILMDDEIKNGYRVMTYVNDKIKRL